MLSHIRRTGLRRPRKRAGCREVKRAGVQQDPEGDSCRKVRPGELTSGAPSPILKKCLRKVLQTNYPPRELAIVFVRGDRANVRLLVLLVVWMSRRRVVF
jgi:hypothetical protein